MIRAVSVFFVLSFLFFAPGAAQEQKPAPGARRDIDAKTIEDTLGVDWFGVYLGGKKIGYVRSSREKQDGAFIDSFHMQMKIARFDDKIELIISTKQYYETKAPYRFLKGEHQQSGPPTVTTRVERGDAKFGAAKFKVTRLVGKQERVSEVEPFDFTLADNMESELWLKAKPKVGDKITTRDLDEVRVDSQSNELMAIRKSLVSGVEVIFYEVESIPQRLKLKVQARYDERGRLLNGNFTLFELRRESEKDAKNTEFGQDIFVLGMVKVDGPLGGNESVRDLVLEVVGKEGAVFEDGPRQKVEMAGSARLLKLGKAHGVSAKATDADIAEALKETQAYPITHPKIKELAAKAVGDAQTGQDKVQKLVNFVNGFVRPDLSPTQPNILDLLERRKGDCKAYALMFNTLARAAGVPARELGGLVYMGDDTKSFGGHAWNEVVIDGVWVPIDASRRQAEVDATHLSLGSDGKDANLLKIMGGKLSFKMKSAK